jgi:ribonuclease BN (tRNA processing enzyme)
MKVTVVGTSCTWFSRNNTSFIVDDDIIIDVPEGSYKSIVKDIDIFKTKCIFCTHFHTDHFVGVRIIVTQILRNHAGRKEKLRVYGPHGILDKIIEFNKLFLNGKDECSKEETLKYVEFIELEDGMEIKEGNYNITSYKMEHGNVETFGFTFTDKNNTTVGFSADTKPCANLNKILEKSNYAFVELSAKEKSNTHVSIDDFNKLIKKYDKVKIFPVHTSDYCQEYVEKHNLNPLIDGQILEF